VPSLILLKPISQEFVSLLFMIMENKWKSLLQYNHQMATINATSRHYYFQKS